MQRTDRPEKRISDRLTQLCLALPEAAVEVVAGEEHLIFRVRNRTFAYYLHDHHGDGEIAACVKVDSGMNEALSQSDPSRFFLPTYLAHRGWVSIRLDAGTIDWDEIADLAEMSYRLVAPRTLSRKLDEEM